MQEPLKGRTKRAARNEMEGFCLGVSPISTGRNVKLETDLTEPQGKIKK